MIPVNRPTISPSDLEAVRNALIEGWISGESPVVKGLEQELARYAQTEDAVAVASGTGACDLLNESLNLGQGDVILSPATTIISTISHAVRRGVRLDLVDADPATWCMQTSTTVEKLRPDLRAVWLVHLFGLPVDLDPILAKANELGISVYEDAAEAIGLEYKGKPCGGLAHAGTFSFYANKTVTSGEGGAVVTNDAHLANRVRSLRNLCFDARERFVHYELGFNMRLSSLNAALAHSQLLRLEQLVDRKREIGQRYLEGLAGHPWLQLPLSSLPYAQNCFWVFAVVLLDDAPVDASTLQERLRGREIDSRRFFMPLNLQPVLVEMDSVSREPMPVSENLWMRGIYLPSGVGTRDEEIDRVVDALWDMAR